MNSSAFLPRFSLCAFLFLCLLIVPRVYGAIYYVSSSGSDGAAGTSEESPWQTLAKVNTTTFAPGDVILFKKGDTWRGEQLRVPSSGTENNYITFGAYGEGERPEILGSFAISSWTGVATNIYRSVATVSSDPWEVGYDGAQVFFEELDGSVSWGSRKNYNATFSNLIAEYDWTWDGGFIYVYAPGNPGSRYIEVEVPQLAQGIQLLDHNYISIRDLAVKYFVDAGIYDSYATPAELHGLSVTGCEISHIGQKDGAAAYGLNVHHSDAYYGYNDIHNCGRRGISLTMYNTAASVQRNVVIEHNHLHDGWHTTALDCNVAGPHTIENIVFRNNLVTGDADLVLGGENSNSNHMFIANQSGGSGTIRDIHIYNNIFAWASASSIKTEGVHEVYINFNTFYNSNPTLTNWQAHVYTSGVDGEYVIENNIFHNNSVDNKFTAIKIDASDIDNFTVNHNLYYQSGQGKRFWWVNGGTSYYDYQWEAYRGATGNDLGSPTPADPLFVAPGLDFSLQDESPARGVGAVVAGIDRDYIGKPHNTPPDLGALQYGAVPSDINGDNRITLTDVIAGLQLLSGLSLEPAVEADVDGNAKIDMAEILFVLEHLQ